MFSPWKQLLIHTYKGGQNPYAYFVVYRKAMTQLAKHGISTRFIISILQPQVVCKTVKTLG